ncbi:MAG: ThiF family adenylyltransferase [Deltaproteobacteria bacterium]|nr:ThiF family adenylyltransferase [Deltaproteobacteria bacterium]
MNPTPSFDYDVAFGRNRGLVSMEEQRRLRGARVAIIGAGGVGGIHALTLARLGVGHFRLVDPDTFDLVNFNRQSGATMQTLGQPKASSVAAQVHAINPDAEVEAFNLPLDEGNVCSLLQNVDLVVDGLDFFALDARITTYGQCEEQGTPVVTSGPLGMSATMHIFAPGGMSFTRYFDLHAGMSELDRFVAFLVGLTPRLTQRPYMDINQLSLEGHYGPSLGAACALCAGVVGVEALRVLLGRPGLKRAPHYYQFDAYRRCLRKGYLWGGNRNPIQRLKRFLVKRQILTSLRGKEGDEAVVSAHARQYDPGGVSQAARRRTA